MLDKDYFNKLSIFVGKTINWSCDNNTVVVACDNELKFIIKYENDSQYSLYCENRNYIELISTYLFENELRRKFALRIRNILGKGFDYKYTSMFRKAVNIDMVKRLMSLYCISDYYSIDLPMKGKINLESEENEKYSVFYIDFNGNRHYMVDSKNASSAFARFYNEVTYLYETVKRINEYSRIFEDEINDKEILHKLIYNF